MNGRLGIKHLDGSTLAGLEQEYSGPEILVGTSAAAHICFDADDDPGVEPKHATLSLRPDGVWLESKTTSPVLVNGQPAQSPVVLQSGDTVQLGPNGPQFQVTVHALPSSNAPASTVMGGRRTPDAGAGSPTAPTPPAAAPASSTPPVHQGIAPTVVGKRATPGSPGDTGGPGQPPPVRLNMGGGRQTAPNAPPPPPSPMKNKRGKQDADFGPPQPAHRPPGAGLGMNTVMGLINNATRKERGRTTLRLVALFVVLVAVSGAAAYAFWPDPADPGTPPSPPAPPGASWTAVTNRVSPSVCLAIERLPSEAHQAISYGTAWSVDTENGWLATNSHVAESFYNEVDGKKVEMIVRTPGNDPKDLRITEVVIHPGYKKWSELASRFNPFYPAEERFFTDKMFANCDVALMRVHPDDRKHMPPAIPLASDEEIKKVGVSYETASFGYSYENQIMSTEKPSPEGKFGVVNKTTDGFLGPSRPELIYFNWSITGGASGSPVVNREGKVVALIAANQFHFTDDGRRVPAGSSLGPDARFLKQLLNQTVEEEQAKLTALWEAEFERMYLAGTAFDAAVASSIAYGAFSMLDRLGLLEANRDYLIKPFSTAEVQLDVSNGQGSVTARGVKVPEGRMVMIGIAKSRFTPMYIFITGNDREETDLGGYNWISNLTREGTVDVTVKAGADARDGSTVVTLHVFHIVLKP